MCETSLGFVQILCLTAGDEVAHKRYMAQAHDLIGARSGMSDRSDDGRPVSMN